MFVQQIEDLKKENLTLSENIVKNETSTKILYSKESDYNLLQCMPSVQLCDSQKNINHSVSPKKLQNNVYVNLNENVSIKDCDKK